MSEEFLIYDKKNKPRKVKNLRKVFYDLPNELGNYDIKSVPCIEYLVIGGTVPWLDWMRFDTFKLLNPSIEVKWP